MTNNPMNDALRALAKGTASTEVRDILTRQDTWGGQSAGSLVVVAQALLALHERQGRDLLRDPAPALAAAVPRGRVGTPRGD